MKNHFSADGLLAKNIAHFHPREAQQKMAEIVESVIQNSQKLIVEAGTGTGKTFAYLVPALISDKKVIISTGSKALQDQLYQRDLPIIIKALNYGKKIALLKGRSNYLCLERLNRRDGNEALGIELSAELLDAIVKIKKWALTTRSGDIAGCSIVKEESTVWPLVTSTNDNCLGSDCSYYQDCFVLKARRKAIEASLVIINHHIFFADSVIKESGFAELIPQADVFIFDEAHQLPDIASQYFGQYLTTRQLMDLAKELIQVYHTELKDVLQLKKSAEKLLTCTQEFRISMEGSAGQGNLRDLFRDKKVVQHFTLLSDTLILCGEVAGLHLNRSKLLDTLFERIMRIQECLANFKDLNIPGFSYWFECTARYFTLAITPLSVQQQFSNIVNNRPNTSWVFTSATLSIDNNLKHFSHKLGLGEQIQSLLLTSPFNYQEQALLYVPRYLPLPNQVGNAYCLANYLQPIIEANSGRCFFLCTSILMVQQLAKEFREILTLPILIQGEMPKAKLLDDFVKLGNALLIATSSFWEGVDMRGDVLSCVIIDKLPFSSPDNPLTQARIEDCRLQNKDPFFEVQLPEAVIALKQGVGRLIRDVNDYGIVIICDQRLATRPYGEVFLKSLPPLSRTRDWQKVLTFIKQKDIVSKID